MLVFYSQNFRFFRENFHIFRERTQCEKCEVVEKFETFAKQLFFFARICKSDHVANTYSITIYSRRIYPGLLVTKIN